MFGTSMSTHRILEVKKLPRVGLSPIKAVRELGLERRETVWSLSVVGAGNLRRSSPSTQGPEWTDQ